MFVSVRKNSASINVASYKMNLTRIGFVSIEKNSTSIRNVGG